MATRTTTDGMEIIKKRFGVDPRSDERVQQHAGEFRVAQIIFDARKASGFTQQQLADAVGTTQSVISQLEDADYDGHSLSMLRRVAKALNMKVHIELVPDDQHAQLA